MEKKRVIPTWVSVMLVALLISCMAICIYLATEIVAYPSVLAVRMLDCVGCILALIYCFKGYSKNAALSYKLFCVSCCLSCGFALFSVASVYQSGSFISALMFAMHLLIFASLSILSTANDLGKKKSLVLAGIVMLCTLVNLSTLIGTSFSMMIGMIENILLRIVLFIIIYAKYQDKAARGVK